MRPLLTLKILLPYKVFLELENVSSIIAETDKGSFGILPQRLDGVAALIPGILSYRINNGEINYLAIDEGILIKKGSEVFLSVRNAIGGKSLGKLHESVEKEFKNLDEKEKNIRSTLTKLEIGFMHTFEKIRRT
ncbi:MAG TPA: F0F1 ATP synthase subunit epsilon [Cytophagaceae bacterium]|jgi:F-type H+-transporting ATPase subunit epsilon|nr:F0F1 ATP synthase subunit epsilon [Cytophagaceae bacterium]